MKGILKKILTWADAFNKPLEVPSDSGKVISAANSNPRGKYPVMKNLEENERPYNEDSESIINWRRYKIFFFKFNSFFLENSI